MRRITIGKAPFYAGMATVGFAVLERNHADQLIALQFGLERTSDTAIGTGCNNGPFGRAQFNDGFFNQCPRRASLHTGTAADTIRGQEIVQRTACRHTAVKAAAFDGQGKGTLDLFAGAHTAVAHDTFAGVIIEIRVRAVTGQIIRIGFARCIAHLEMVCHFGVFWRLIADITQTNGAGHVLQFAITICRTSQTIQWMVRDI